MKCFVIRPSIQKYTKSGILRGWYERRHWGAGVGPECCGVQSARRAPLLATPIAMPLPCGRPERSGLSFLKPLTRTLTGTLAKGHFHHNGEVQSDPVNYRCRVQSAASTGTGSDGCEVLVLESVRGSLGGLTWLPWFSPASGACRAPDGRRRVGDQGMREWQRTRGWCG